MAGACRTTPVTRHSSSRAGASSKARRRDSKERYISGNRIRRLAEEAGAPDIERKVLFLQELLNTARSFAPSLFDGNEGRMKVLDAVQDAVDAAIAEEDAWLAEQG